MKKNFFTLSLILFMFVAFANFPIKKSFAGTDASNSVRDLVNKRVEEIRETGNTNVTNRAGAIYYVSNAGNDDNSGTESSPWKTIEKVNSAFADNTIKNGDTILFRRGDTFRGNIIVRKYDITFGAYGNESNNKPELLASTYDGAKDGVWIEEKPNIWRYKVNGEDPFESDVGTVWFFCNAGNENCANEMDNDGRKFSYANKKMSNSKINESNLNLSDVLTNDLDIYHYGHANRSDSSKKGGALYVYSVGNPSERFDEIEFSLGQNGINIASYSNAKIDNLTIKYAGNHAIGAGTVSNLVVTNCEIGYIGGSVQNYNESTGNPTRYGNGIEIWGEIKDTTNFTVTDGYILRNNYIYQVYDAGMTFQYSATASSKVELVNFDNNVVEYCNYNIEYWNKTDSTNPDDQNGTYITEYNIKNNILRFSGIGISSTRPDLGGSAHIKSWLQPHRNLNLLAENGSYKIENNIFYGASNNNFYIWAGEDSSLPIFRNNVVYSKNTSKFGYFYGFDESKGTVYSAYGSKPFEKDSLEEKYPTNTFNYLENEELPPKEIKVSNVKIVDSENRDIGSTVELKEGLTTRINASIEPSNATNKKINITSSNPEIAYVTVENSNIELHTLNEGTTTITVTSEDGNYQKNYTVIVKREQQTESQDIAIDKIEIVSPRSELNIGENINLSLSITPQNATNKTVEWTSSNTSVASVDQDGRVVAHSAGTAIITVTSSNGKTSTTEIRVIENTTDDSIQPVAINLNATKASLKKGESLQLIATVLPENSTSKDVLWKSNNENVLIVNNNGLVIAKNKGTAIITATIKNTDIKQTSTISVIEEVENKSENLSAEMLCMPYISYSTSSETNNSVMAVINFKNKDCTAVNTDNNSHEFFENGNFTFEYIDKNNSKGYMKATVSWINKTSSPEANPKTGSKNKNILITALTLSFIANLIYMKFSKKIFYRKHR